MKKTAAVTACFLIAALLPLCLSRYWQSVLFSPVGIFVLLALGLNIVVGMAGLLDLGYVAFYAVGAYTTAVLTTSEGWDAWEALPVAVAVAMIAGVVLGAPTLRLRGDYLAIVTLGFGEIVRISANNTEALGSTRGIVGIPHPASIGPLSFAELPLPYYYVSLVLITAAITVVARLGGSRVGRAWAALREDEDAAEVMGVHTFTMKLWAFAMGASTGGLAGWLYASRVGYINPENFQLFLSITILAAVVLGGMGSIPGVIVGGFVLAFLPEYLRDAAAGSQLASWLHAVIGGPVANITEYRVLLFGAAVVLMMVFRPQGIVPNRRRARELVGIGGLSGGSDDVDNATDGNDVSDTAPEDRLLRSAGTVPKGALPKGAVPKGVVLPSSFGERSTSPPRLIGTHALTLKEVSVRFGGVQALQSVSFRVEQGAIYGVIGPNGAGKTTLFNCITGVNKLDKGVIRLGERSLAGLSPHRVTEAGIARTFQNIRLFAGMTALENVMVGADSRHRATISEVLLGFPRYRRGERLSRIQAAELLEFVGLRSRASELATNLSYGDQRRLEIARAMACGPSVLLLDEPAAGMNPSEKMALADLIRHIRASGFTVVLIEHDMGLVMNLCDTLCVLDFGEKIAEGAPDVVRQDPMVIQAYLGVDDNVAPA